MSTTITISEALKGALEDLRDEAHDGLTSLDATINFVLDHPDDYDVAVTGYEETLTEPVKVEDATQTRVNAEKKRGDYADYDAVLRDRIGAPERETGGEEPVEVRPLSD